MIFFIFLLILFLVLFWPSIRALLARAAANKAEDYLRNAAGLPPRPGSRRARREARQQKTGKQSFAHSASQQRAGKRSTGKNGNGHIIPPEYAEDVDFVETIDWSETTIRTEQTSEDPSGKTFRTESQVTDVEWTDIKTTRKK